MKALFFFLFAALILSARADDAVAHVGTQAISSDEVRPFFATLDAQQKAAFATDPALFNRTVETILIQRAVYQRALTAKWDQQPAVVADLQRVRENAVIESYLTAQTQPPADYPSEAEIKTAYDANQEKLVVPKQFQLAQIFLAAPKTAGPTPADTQIKLNTLIADLGKPGADFAAIARAASDDKASAARGGEIGWVTESQIQPELRAQVLNLGKGKTSGPIKLDDGWHILRVNDVKEAYTASLDEVRPELVKQLRGQKAQALRRTYLAQLLHDNPITLSSTALAQLLPGSTAK